jgi:hypothetical protein
VVVVDRPGLLAARLPLGGDGGSGSSLSRGGIQSQRESLATVLVALTPGLLLVVALLALLLVGRGVRR